MSPVSDRYEVTRIIRYYMEHENAVLRCVNAAITGNYWSFEGYPCIREKMLELFRGKEDLAADIRFTDIDDKQCAWAIEERIVMLMADCRLLTVSEDGRTAMPTKWLFMKGGSILS